MEEEEGEKSSVNLDQEVASITVEKGDEKEKKNDKKDKTGNSALFTPNIISKASAYYTKFLQTNTGIHI